jgi:hypothetical protein
VSYVSGLLIAERHRRGIRRGRRVPAATGKGSWYCAGSSTQPGSAISQSTTRPSTCRPPLRRPAGSAARGPRRRADPYDLDGTLIHTDRSKAVGPTAGVDLWVVGHPPPSPRERPGRHRPGRMASVDVSGATGREHDSTCARTHPACSTPSPTGPTSHAVSIQRRDDHRRLSGRANGLRWSVFAWSVRLVRGGRVSSGPLVTPQTMSGALVDAARPLTEQLGWLQPRRRADPDPGVLSASLMSRALIRPFPTPPCMVR